VDGDAPRPDHAPACRQDPGDPPPTPQQLEAAGAHIGLIDIDVEDIFDPTDPHENKAPFMLANHLHMTTHEDAIRSQLLFSESDPYSQQKIEETERLLRGRRYLFDAWIRPTCYHEDTQTVDMSVRVRDVWSLNPGVSFSRKGGANGVSAEVQDENFLGRGELVSLGWNSNVDRTSVNATYEDPQLFGTWWRGKVSYSDTSDGHYGHVNVGLPFYSLDSRWSANADVAGGDLVETRYQLGHILDEYAVREQHLDLSGGISDGLRDGWTRRWLAGLRYDSRQFSETTDRPLVAALPEDRKLVYPWIGLEWIQNDFRTTHNVDQIGRTEDQQFGTSFRTSVGFASEALGSDRTAVMLDGQARTAFHLGDDDSLFLDGGASGRLESGALRDAALQGEVRYYHRQRENLLFFSSLNAATTVEPDLDHQLLLGGDTGLRGYPLRYQSGKSSVLATVEERIYTKWYPFRLFNVGAVVFADAGRTYGDDFAGAPPLGWLGDVGVGLRIGNARSGLGNVLHVDLAVPVSRQPGIDSVQLLIDTRASF